MLQFLYFIVYRGPGFHAAHVRTPRRVFYALRYLHGHKLRLLSGPRIPNRTAAAFPPGGGEGVFQRERVPDFGSGPHAPHSERHTRAIYRS